MGEKRRIAVTTLLVLFTIIMVFEITTLVGLMRSIDHKFDNIERTMGEIRQLTDQTEGSIDKSLDAIEELLGLRDTSGR